MARFTAAQIITKMENTFGITYLVCSVNKVRQSVNSGGDIIDRDLVVRITLGVERVLSGSSRFWFVTGDITMFSDDTYKVRLDPGLEGKGSLLLLGGGYLPGRLLGVLSSRSYWSVATWEV